MKSFQKFKSQDILGFKLYDQRVDFQELLSRFLILSEKDR